MSAIDVLPEEHGIRYLRACAAMAMAADAQELTEAAWNEALRPLGVSAVTVAVLEPDGAARLVGAHGLPSAVCSGWRRVPVELNVAYLRALAGGQPLWLSRADAVACGLAVLGDGALRACLPLEVNGRRLGVLTIIWSAPPQLTAADRSLIGVLATAYGNRLSALLAEGEAEPAAHWIAAVLDALPGSVALLCPIRDTDLQIVDWRFDSCAPGSRDAAGRTAGEITGHRLLDLYPALVDTPVLSGYERALRTGESFTFGPAPVAAASGSTAVMSLTASRFGDGLLVSWQFHDHVQQLAASRRLLELVSGSGWARWSLPGGPMDWSPTVYQTLGRDPCAGPVRLDVMHRFFAAGDQPVWRKAFRRLTRDAQPVDVVLTLSRNGVCRPLRFAAEPACRANGSVYAVTAALRVLDPSEDATFSDAAGSACA